MPYGQIPRRVIAEIIEADDDDRRFERFVADLFSARENIHYETTAPTGDDGTDARASVGLSGGVARVCATTQKRDFKTKGERDIDSVKAQSVHVLRFHMCFSKAVRDDTLGELTKYAKTAFPQAEIVECHGLTGLADIAFRYQRPFLDNYSRDLDAQSIWWDRQATDEDEQPQADQLLRLALTTVFTSEILDLRSHFVENAVISALGGGKSIDSAQLSARIASSFQLSLPVHQSYLTSAVQSLRAEKLVESTKHGYRLTNAGAARLESMLAHGARSALEAASSFRTLLASIPPAELPGTAFSSLWKLVQLRLVQLFLNNGLRVVREIRALATGEGSPQASPILSSTFTGLAEDVRGLGLNPQAEQRVVSLIYEMLARVDSQAFQWIGELAVKYVVLCSLGLDPELQRQVRDRIQQWIVIPDTHVLLSYVCVGDESHEACETILRQLHQFGAEIWFMQPVLEEVVHHAVISGPNFDEWAERYRRARVDHPDVRPHQLLQSDDNAFVKGFAGIASEAFKRNEWLSYLGQYCGSRNDDIKPMTAILQQELKGNMQYDCDKTKVAAKVFATELRAGNTDPYRTLKASWDARLVISCLLRREEQSLCKRMMVVSDADKLRGYFNRQVHPDRRRGLSVIDPGAVACALASIPGTAVNLECVRHVLFGGGLQFQAQKHLDLLTRPPSENYDLLRTATLRSRLDEQLAPEANRSV